ncbi:MAG TPA: nuclear transport factor 2 family protein [Pyrinomonadaceae bacterium]|jgi:ketosteroid isomerase-like protein|nr:nuclear transport factor 2 family protein [Pyrinomonadaceae bacterium]
MRNLLLATLICGLFAAVTVGQQPVTAEQKKAAGEVMATISKWAVAVRDRDAKALEEIFDDEVIITMYDGNTRGKAEEMAAIRPNPNMRLSSVANEDVGIKVFGDVAVVTALTKIKMVAGGKESVIALRYTAVFVKRDGNWRIVALQTARAPQPAS